MPTSYNDTQPSSYRLQWKDRLPRPLQPLASLPWWQLGVALVVGVVLANIITTPNPRVIKLIAGLVLAYVAIKTKPLYALCFIVIMFPIPFGIFVGSSTMIFVVLAALVYLGRLSMKQVPALRSSPGDIGIGLMLACYLLSFYNVENPVILQRGVLNMFSILSSFILFFMVSNFIRTENHLKTVVKFFVIMMGICFFIGMFELLFPGRSLIPHWIQFGASHTDIKEGYRVGGPFHDYELFGEFCAISFFLLVFVSRRATGHTRLIGAGLAVVSVFMLLVTVTRGATLAFLGGLVYFLFLIRRELKFRDVVIIFLCAFGLYFAMELVITNFTRSGSVIERVLGTKFVGGLPDSRTGWPAIWARVLEHPFIGHGPYYDLGLTRGFTGEGLYTYIYPHCQYLWYAHTIGLIGVGAFLVVSLRLLWLSFKGRAETLREQSYPRSLLLVLHVMLLVFLVDQIKIDYLRNASYTYFPWLLMGLIAASHRLVREEKQAAAEPTPPVDES